GLGVIHRNLRPENVLIAEKSHVKLTDFGMNRRFSDMDNEAYAEPSPLQYICPELIRGEKVDTRGDLYSLGILMYEMLTGLPPFVGENVAARQLTEPPVP